MQKTAKAPFRRSLRRINVDVRTVFRNGFLLGYGVDMGFRFGANDSFDLNFPLDIAKQFHAPLPTENGDIVLQASVGGRVLILWVLGCRVA